MLSKRTTAHHIVHSTLNDILERIYEAEEELEDLRIAADALRPLVEGPNENSSAGNGASRPCANLTAQEAVMFVLREKPTATWTNAEILDRMEALGWKTNSKSSGGVSGMVSSALSKNAEAGLVTKLDRGQWTLREEVDYGG